MWVLIKMRVIGKLVDGYNTLYENEVIVELDLLKLLAQKYPATARMYADNDRSKPSNKVDLTHETIEKIAFQVSQNMRNK